MPVYILTTRFIPPADAFHCLTQLLAFRTGHCPGPCLDFLFLVRILLTAYGKDWVIRILGMRREVPLRVLAQTEASFTSRLFASYQCLPSPRPRRGSCAQFMHSPLPRSRELLPPLPTRLPLLLVPFPSLSSPTWDRLALSPFVFQVCLLRGKCFGFLLAEDVCSVFLPGETVFPANRDPSWQLSASGALNISLFCLRASVAGVEKFLSVAVSAVRIIFLSLSPAAF